MTVVAVVDTKILICDFFFSAFVDVGLMRQEPTFAVGESCTMRTNEYKVLSLNKLYRDWRNVANKTSISLKSTKLYIWRTFYGKILRVCSLVSNIIYVAYVAT